MKVIFGGAFNPVTNAHIKVCQYIQQKMDVEEFIFLPVSSAYTKSDLASNYHRLNMLKLATKNCDKALVSSLEIEDNDFLGTYKSLIRFYDKYEDDIAFVIGADNLELMDKWINIEGILSEFKIIVLGRDNIDINQMIDENDVLNKYKDNFIIFKDFNVSTIVKALFQVAVIIEIFIMRLSAN